MAKTLIQEIIELVNGSWKPPIKKSYKKAIKAIEDGIKIRDEN